MQRARSYLFPQRLGPVGIALLTWRIWRRIPRQYRRQIVMEARRYTPILAGALAEQIRRAREATKPKPKP